MANWDLLAGLVRQAWQVAALALVVALVVRLAAKNRPHLAHALWLIVLIKCVTPPIWSSPLGIFCWLRPMSSEATTVPAGLGIPAVSPAASQNSLTEIRSAEYKRIADGAPVDASPGALASTTEVPADVIDASAPSIGASLGTRLARWAIYGWLIGVATIATLAVVRWWRCWRKLSAADDPLDTATLEAMVARLARRLKLQRRVRLVVTASRVGPAVIGLWRPTVLLPECVTRGKAATELEPIVAHELIHIRRGDLWVGLLQLVVQAVWWFHPLVWLAARRISREAERCCDEEVIGELAYDPARYARSLLSVLELKRTLLPVPTVPGVRAVEITSQRLERIMTLGQGSRRRTPWWCWAVMLASGVIALPGSALLVAATEEAPESAPNATADSHAAPPAAVDKPTEPQITRVYDVADLLASIRGEVGCDEAIARRLLWQQIVWNGARDMLPINRILQPGEGPLPVDPQGNWFDRSRWAETRPGLSLVPADLRGKWFDGKLIVRQSAAWHERAGDSLASLRKLRFASLKIQTRFLTCPPEMFERIAAWFDNKWTTLPAPAPNESLGISAISSAREALNPTTNAAIFAIAQNLPVMISVIDDQMVVKICDEMAGDRRSNVLQAPAIVLFNGQTSFITDVSQTPFVVGVKPGGKPGVVEPQIRVVTEGSQIRLKPLLDQESDLVRLNFEMVLSFIREVEEFAMRGPSNESIKVQIPEVAETRIASMSEVPLGKTLLVMRRQPKSWPDQLPRAFLLRVTKASKESDGRADGDWPSLRSTNVAATDAPRAAAPAAKRGEPETQRLIWGIGVNSKAGLTGRIIRREGSSDASAKGTALEPAAGDVAKPSDAPAPSAANPRYGQTRRSKKRPQVDERLKTPVSLDFRGVPLSEALEHVAKTIKVNVQLDPRGLAAEGVTSDTPVTVRLDAPIMAANALRLLLEPLHLDYEFKDEVLVVTSELLRHGKIYTVTYNVADLVVPVPDLTSTKAGEKPAAQPDFRPLKQWITTTVLPESWSENGGPCSVSSFPNNLSLVISHTSRGHGEVAELLTQLRQFKSLQVVLHFENVPDAKAFRQQLNLGDAALQKINVVRNDAVAKAYTPAGYARTTDCLVGPPRDAALAKLVARGPAVELSNRQVAVMPIQLPASAELLRTLCVSSFVSTDHRSVRLGIHSRLPQVAGANWDETFVILRDGESLLVDLAHYSFLAAPEIANAANETAIQDRPPIHGDGIRNAALTLITPRIIAESKEEARLKQPNAKPTY